MTAYILASPPYRCAPWDRTGGFVDIKFREIAVIASVHQSVSFKPGFSVHVSETHHINQFIIRRRLNPMSAEGAKLVF